MLEKCLLGAVSLTKNTANDKCKYPRYGIRFDGLGSFHILVLDRAKT